MEASVSTNLQDLSPIAHLLNRSAPHRPGPVTELAEGATAAALGIVIMMSSPLNNTAISATSPPKTSLRSSRSLAMDGIHDDQCFVLVQAFSAGLGAMTGSGREECLDE